MKDTSQPFFIINKAISEIQDNEPYYSYNCCILMTITPIMARQKIVQTAGRQQLGDFAPEFAHLAFEVPGEKIATEWLEPVSDSEYNSLVSK